MEILCFFAGVVFVYTKNACLLCFLFTVLLFKPRWTMIAWFLSAIVWCLCHQAWIADRGMPDLRMIPNATLIGYIASIPTITASKTQFQFQITHLDKQPVNALLLLSCYNHCPDFRANQEWRLRAKLQKPQNLANPGGFNYLGWLHARHINWTGYVLKNSSQLIESSASHDSLLGLRQRMADTLAHIDPDIKTLGILQALTLGVTTHIDKDGWDLFRRTGTTHLMVISGSHIGLVAGLVYACISWLWCRFPKLCLHYPAPKIASIAGFIMAGIYSLIAGFAAPSQRSLIGCFFMFLCNFCSQRFGIWQSWRYALLAVLVFEPHAVTMPGFYLSFIAVAILVLINQRYALTGLRKTLLMQVACLVGLMPLTLFWFSYGAVNGFVANVVAIPWVGFIIVPLGLFITLTGHWGVLPWSVSILTHSIDYLLYYLAWVDSFAFINFNILFTHVLTPLALMIAMGMLVLLPIIRLIPVLLIIAVAAVFPAYEKIKLGDAKIDVLDVGQGLAVVVHTANHVLIYDTGVKFYQGSDMGKLALIPYLKTLGVKTINKVIISHPDLDHRGGLASLEEAYPVNELVVDDPRFYKRGSSCHHHGDWTWDGISFHFFSIATPLKNKNNASCVLQISTKAGQVLLSGDIEKPAEQYLVDTYGAKLASSILVIPHHGSKTSSTPAFIKNVAPRYAIVSYGFDNRYHFPHQQAMQTYQQNHIPVYNTVDSGMISVLLKANSISEQPILYLSGHNSGRGHKIIRWIRLNSFFQEVSNRMIL